MDRSGQAGDLDAVEAELHYLTLPRRHIPLVGVVRRLAHLRPRVGHPEPLLAVVLDQGEPVTLLEADRPGPTYSAGRVEYDDFRLGRVEPDDLARAGYG